MSFSDTPTLELTRQCVWHTIYVQQRYIECVNANEAWSVKKSNLKGTIMKKTAVLLIMVLLCGAMLFARAEMTEEEIAADVVAVMQEKRDTIFRIAIPGNVGINRWVNYLFEKSHPGVRVEYVSYEPFAFETELMADPSRFDMIVTNRPEVLYAQNLCMNGYSLKGGWPEHLLNMRTMCEAKDGALMGLPVFVNIEGLRFNTALAEDYGIETPSENYTWEDLMPLCERVSKLRAEGANIYLMVGSGSADSIMDDFMAMIHQYIAYCAAKTPFQVDEKELTALLNVWATLRKSEAIKPFTERAGEEFYQNVLLLNSAFDPQFIDPELLPMPGLYREAPGRIAAAYLLCGSTVSRQPELVKDYMTLYMSEEGQQYAGETLPLSKKIPERQLLVANEGAKPEASFNNYLVLMDQEGRPVDPPYNEEQIARAQAIRKCYLEGAGRLTVSKDLYQAWISALARYQSGKLTASDMVAELNAKISFMMGD